MAEATGQEAATKAMDRVLDDGKELDQRLTALAEKEVTPALLSGSDGEEEPEDEGNEGSNAGNRSRKAGGSERRARN